MGEPAGERDWRGLGVFCINFDGLFFDLFFIFLDGLFLGSFGGSPGGGLQGLCDWALLGLGEPAGERDWRRGVLGVENGYIVRTYFLLTRPFLILPNYFRMRASVRLSREMLLLFLGIFRVRRSVSVRVSRTTYKWGYPHPWCVLRMLGPDSGYRGRQSQRLCGRAALAAQALTVQLLSLRPHSEALADYSVT